MKDKKAVVLVNVGTPDNAGVPAVRHYLREFLGDKRVIDLPWLFRKVLVNLIIVPFRSPRSAALYQKLWTDKGSPLLLIQESLRNRLADAVGEKADIYSAMRYGSPSLQTLLYEIALKGYKGIVIVPMYPHYASSTTGSVEDVIMRFKASNGNGSNMVMTDPFFSHPLFIEAFANRVREAGYSDYDHILFSYHGLPLSHLQKIHPDRDPRRCECEMRMPDYGRNCYKAQCYETTRLLAERLNLNKESYTVAFQSRLTKNWLSPFADEVVQKLARSGVRRLLVVAPSFVADCLETIIEIGEEYRKIFISAGGTELTLVRSLNDSGEWVTALREMVL